MTSRSRVSVLRGRIAAAVLLSMATVRAAIAGEPGRELVKALLSSDSAARAKARDVIVRLRDRSLLPALVDALFFSPAEGRGDVVACLEALSGEKLGAHYRYWFEYVGGHEEIRPARWYRGFKADLFARIDPAFARFLDPAAPMTIRPEEILSGGVRKDEIPALRNPRTVPRAQASFLSESEIVFGMAVGGEFRAYPQRILDWHEMANDVLGGEPFALSYCTLCGSAIAYRTRLSDGRVLQFGSSGLLYRSNKLMYDDATFSLWSNLTGEPVAGPLVNRGIVLPMLPVTVTSWGEWSRRHPDTSVVDRDTGYPRDYSPGAAYGRYFASPELMFPVWKRNEAAGLDRKAWVYSLRRGPAAKAYPLDRLFRERVVNDSLGSERVVLVADEASGAVRAYAAGGHEFAEGPSSSLVEPSTQVRWRVGEDSLDPETPGLSSLPRLPGHRAFWFAWYAFFPQTEVYDGCALPDAGGR